jgi:hypothetical protein
MIKFGYLNQNNPIFISDNEAQEMVNCAIDRGYLEFKEFKVNAGIYDAVPGRKVSLPSGDDLVIDPTARTPSDGENYAARGQVRVYDSPTNTEPFCIPAPTSGCLTSLSVHHTVFGTDYSNRGGNKTTVAGQYRYVIDLEDLDTSTPVSYLKEGYFFKYVTLDGTRLNESQFSWRAGDADSPEAGKIIINLASDPGAGKTVAILFHFYTNHKRVFNQPGKYFYALTYFDPAKQRESPPLYLDVEITENDISAYSGECFIEFTDLLVEATPLSEIPGLEINIYRIPFGADEYLLTATKDPGAFSITFYDETTDAELGAICATIGNTNLPLESTDVVSIALHKDKLFVATLPGLSGNGGFVYFSKTNVFNEFKASSFFSFNADVVAMAQFNETLAIFTKQEAYILYGNDEDSFSMGRIDFKASEAFSRNSAQAVAGKLLALTKAEGIKTDSILLFNNRLGIDISLPIKDVLAIEGYSDNTAINAANKNLVLDNRYYVFELLEGNQAVEEKSFNVVYDSITRGFCLYDESYKDSEDTPLFKWRTKEFHVDGRMHGVQFHRWLYVRGEGNFTVEILGDGDLVTSKTFSLSEVETKFFQIKSTRYTTYSMRFIGEQGAKIHDWGASNGNY